MNIGACPRDMVVTNLTRRDAAKFQQPDSGMRSLQEFLICFVTAARGDRLGVYYIVAHFNIVTPKPQDKGIVLLRRAEIKIGFAGGLTCKDVGPRCGLAVATNEISHYSNLFFWLCVSARRRPHSLGVGSRSW